MSNGSLELKIVLINSIYIKIYNGFHTEAGFYGNKYKVDY